MKRIILIILCLVVVTCGFAQKKKVANPVAPEIALQSTNGKVVKLSSLRGKYVVIDFWGTWCYWCVKGMPTMKSYYKKYSKQLEIYGVNCGDSQEQWKAGVKELGLTWVNVYMPKDDNLLKTYAVRGFPTKIILDKKGHILKRVEGEDPQFYEYLDNLLKK